MRFIQQEKAQHNTTQLEIKDLLDSDNKTAQQSKQENLNQTRDFSVSIHPL